ncbi:MAG: cation:proton antiporter [Candidatus Nanopelagicales bacterium]
MWIEFVVPVGYLLAGIALLLAIVLPRLLHRLALSPALIFVGAGILAGLLPISGPLDVQANLGWIEHLTELCVIVSLMGVGLALDRPLSWRAWASTWRLLAIAMPLFIALVGSGAWLLGMAPATALLLAAVLAPTDPVLATDVQVGEPTSDPGNEDEIRFALTSEAGLNDGLAFPFVYAALLLAAAGSLEWVGGWIAWELTGKIVLGLVCGALVGAGFGLLAFRAPVEQLRLAGTTDVVAVLATTFLAYGIAELVGGYGFLAVFAAGMALRGRAREHDFHRASHTFITQFERILTMGLLVAMGYAVGTGLLAGLTWQGALLGLVAVLVLRPLVGWTALIGTSIGRPDRRAIAFFGVKGIGSLYYLAFALGEGDFVGADLLWPTVTFTVLVSAVVHGVSATPILSRIDQRMGRATPEPV